MISQAEPTFSKNLSPAPVPKRYFTVSMAEKRMCKRGIRAIVLVRVPFLSEPCQKKFCSVNGPKM